jgi:Uma2 family endonuclease
MAVITNIKLDFSKQYTYADYLGVKEYWLVQPDDKAILYIY